MMRQVVLVLILLVVTTSCGPGSDLQVTTPESTIQLTTPGVNPSLNEPDEEGRVSGFISGFWHGLIAPVMLVGSVFNPVIQMYEVHNNGAEYNFGYLIGVALVFLLLGVLGGRRR
jgi:hypothetical protein